MELFVCTVSGHTRPLGVLCKDWWERTARPFAAGRKSNLVGAARSPGSWLVCKLAHGSSLVTGPLLGCPRAEGGMAE